MTKVTISLGKGLNATVAYDVENGAVVFSDANGKEIGSVSMEVDAQAFGHLMVGGLNRLIGDAKAEERLKLMERLASGEYTVGAGGGRVSDPVEKRQLEIVMADVQAAIKAAGLKVSKFKFGDKEGAQAVRARAIHEIASNPEAASVSRAQAERDVAASKSLGLRIDIKAEATTEPDDADAADAADDSDTETGDDE